MKINKALILIMLFGILSVFSVSANTFDHSTCTNFFNVTINNPNSNTITDAGFFSQAFNFTTPLPNSSCSNFHLVNNTEDEIQITNTTSCSITNGSLVTFDLGKGNFISSASSTTWKMYTGCTLGRVPENKSRLYNEYDGFEGLANSTDICSATNWSCFDVGTTVNTGETNSTTSMSGEKMLILKSVGNFGDVYRGLRTYGNGTLKFLFNLQNSVNWQGGLVRYTGQNTGYCGGWLDTGFVLRRGACLGGDTFASGAVPNLTSGLTSNITLIFNGTNITQCKENTCVSGTDSTYTVGNVGLFTDNGQVEFVDEFRFMAQDNTSGISFSQSALQDIETRPIVKQLSATPSTQNQSFPLTLKANVTDSDGVSAVRFETSISGNLTNFTGTLVSGFYEVNVTSAVIGNHTYRVFANDSANNVNNTETGTFQIILYDVTPPRVVPQTSFPNAQFQNVSVELRVNVTDTSSINLVRFETNILGNKTNYTATLMSGLYKANVSTESLGNFTYRVYARDSNLNVNNTEVGAFQTILNTQQGFAYTSQYSTQDAQEAGQDIAISPLIQLALLFPLLVLMVVVLYAIHLANKKLKKANVK